MKNYFSCLFLFLFFASGYAQQKNSSTIGCLEDLTKKTAKEMGEYDYEAGIEDAMLLLEEAKKVHNPYYHYHGHNFLGVAYEDLQDTLRALKNYEYALKWAQKSENDTLILWSYNNLGNIYSSLDSTREKGIAYYNKVIDLSKKLSIEEESVVPKINIGWTYLDENKADKAYPYLKESLKEIGGSKDQETYSQLLMLMGEYFSKKGEIDSAGFYFQNAAQIAEKDSLLLPASLVYKDYSELLHKEGEHARAYDALLKYNEYNSKLYQRDRLSQIEAANARFNVNEYERNLELAQKEHLYQDQMIKEANEKMIVMIISSLVLLIILLVLFRINRARRVLIRELRAKNEQLTEAKEKAERLSVLKTKFFSTVSHELRTPLYGVIGLTSLLMEDEKLKGHHSDLKALKFSADYLLALINDVLQMNKMESDLVKLENTNFHLPDLMQSILNTFEFRRLQNSNEMHLIIDPEIPQNLVGDSVRLSQVLMNLVGNAIKFTERGNIYLRAFLQGHGEKSCRILFEVEDDGFGIPKNKQKEIFEEFSQLRAADYTYQGTGLGLPIVKKLLLLFKSKIHLKSEEGKGSCFSFSISFEIDTEHQEENEINGEAPDFMEMRGRFKKILIVDDNRINQVVTR
ncbi:MAG: ATP-binding protein, partial [Salegentibacter sp.]